GYPLIETSAANLATLGGIWLLTWLTVLSAGLLGALILWQQRYWKTWGTQAAAVVALLITAQYVAPAQFVQSAGKPIDVALLQGNIPQDLRWLTTMQDKTREIYADLSDEVPANHIEIWPESALTEFYHDAEEFLDDRADIAEQKNGTLIVGIPTYEVK